MPCRSGSSPARRAPGSQRAAPGRRSRRWSRPICGPISRKAPASTTRVLRSARPERTRSASVRVDEVEAVVIGAGVIGLAAARARARANDVDKLEWLSASEARSMEPELHCVAALLSPSTGIIDSHALMLAYQGEAEAAGAFVAFRTPMLGGHLRGYGFELSVGGD